MVAAHKISAKSLGDDVVSRASRRTDSIAGGNKLAVTASALKTTRVAVAVINLKHFNYVMREVTPELLVRVSELLASAGSESARQFRGVLDSFSGDHFILTFNAARLCPMTMQRACQSVIAFAKALETHKSIERIKELVQRQASTAAAAAATAQSRRKSVDGSASAAAAAAAAVPQPGTLLHICAGVASGIATVGNLGSKDIKRFSVIGEVFSRATELEHIANHRVPLPHEHRLPYSIFITSKDVVDVESAMTIEYLDYRRLRHVRTLQHQSSRGGGATTFDAVAIARVLREHAAGGDDDDEWMYAHQQANKAGDKNTEIRNLMFQQLDRGDFDEVENLISTNPGVPSADVVKHMSSSKSPTTSTDGE
jgi:class 3 adenylate cyclase